MSVGHQQMMTEPIKPLGISFFSLMSEYELSRAGGRLFIDLSHDLASAAGRKIVLAALGKNDPLMHNALSNFMKRKELVKSLPNGKRMFKFGAEGFSWSLPADMAKIYRKNDIGIVKRLISKAEESIKNAERNIQHLTGDELFEALLEDQKELKKVLHDKESMAVIMVGIYAAFWINKKWRNGWGKRARPIPFPSRCRTMSHQKWGWLFWMCQMSPGNIRKCSIILNSPMTKPF